MAHLRPEHLAELRRLHDVSLAVIDFCASVQPDFTSAEAMKRMFESALAAQDLRGMRMAARDIRDATRSLQPSERRDLLLHVRRVTGHALEAEEAEDAAAASRIVRRGRARNEREYFVLRSRLDRIQGSPGSAEEEAVLSRLLASYGAESEGAA